MKQYKVLNDYIEDNKLNLEIIIKEYSSYLYTVVRNISNTVLSNEDIEEIISDAFFILWKNKETLDGQDKINFYLVGIVKNLIKERYRKLDNNLNIEDYQQIYSNNDNLSKIYEENEKIRIMEKRLELLNDSDRKIFRLFYYSNKKSKEIAKELNMNEITVRSRLHRIKKQIKNDLNLGGYSYE